MISRLTIIQLRIDEAQNIFQEDLTVFSSELSQDPEKTKWIVDSGHGNFKCVLECVLQARDAYKTQKGDSKMRKALVGLSEKVYLYCGIMDVLVSHHPEYVALVYGAMKFLLVVSAHCRPS